MKYEYCDNWGGDMHFFDSLIDAEVHARKNNMGAVSIYHDGEIVCTVQGELYFA